VEHSRAAGRDLPALLPSALAGVEHPDQLECCVAVDLEDPFGGLDRRRPAVALDLAFVGVERRAPDEALSQ
jgi:hypothetical protein